MHHQPSHRKDVRYAKRKDVRYATKSPKRRALCLAPSAWLQAFSSYAWLQAFAQHTIHHRPPFPLTHASSSASILSIGEPPSAPLISKSKPPSSVGRAGAPFCRFVSFDSADRKSM